MIEDSCSTIATGGAYHPHSTLYSLLVLSCSPEATGESYTYPPTLGARYSLLVLSYSTYSYGLSLTEDL